MKRMLAVAVLALLALPATSRAQEMGPLATVLKARATAYARNMGGAADSMPADKYGWKPSPAQLSFGEIIAHESESNETLCAAIAGGAQTPSESAAGATATKEQLVARIKKSFEYCGTVVAQVKDAALGDSVPYFGGRKATRARAVIALVQDWADHYAQAAMYLRANGILPMSAQPRRP
jgi:DinB family protein